MPGTLVDVVEEIRDRLATAISGGVLTEIKRLRLGSKEEARKLNDYPIINLGLPSGATNPVFVPAGNVMPLSIEVTLLHGKLDEINNTLYKTSNQSGPLYILEKILNTIEKNTSGVIDMAFNNTANNLLQSIFTIDETSAIIEISVILEIETKQFIFGGR